ncbi:adenylate cyclase type 8-like isoform X1 [Sycon ciliatum]|uniref:adenylate cyclase type 8-like isoform X1 n=2 Tax=Sycon ciliatum TaxID=27933 RepID=UPI0031F6E014
MQRPGPAQHASCNGQAGVPESGAAAQAAHRNASVSERIGNGTAAGRSVVQAAAPGSGMNDSAAHRNSTASLDSSRRNNVLSPAPAIAAGSGRNKASDVTPCPTGKADIHCNVTSCPGKAHSSDHGDTNGSVSSHNSAATQPTPNEPRSVTMATTMQERAAENSGQAAAEHRPLPRQHGAPSAPCSNPVVHRTGRKRRREVARIALLRSNRAARSKHMGKHPSRCLIRRGMKSCPIFQTVQFHNDRVKEIFEQYFLPQKLVDLIQASLLLIIIHFSMQVILWSQLPHGVRYLDSPVRYRSLVSDAVVVCTLGILIVMCICLGLRSLLGPTPYLSPGCKLYSAVLISVMIVDSFLMPHHAFSQPFTPTTSLWFVVIVVLTINTKSTFSPFKNCLVTIGVAISWIAYTCVAADVKEQLPRQVGASCLLLFMSITLGVSYKMLTERALRNAFLDTTRNMEQAERINQETNHQESLLVSIFPDSVCKEMTKEIVNDLEEHFALHGDADADLPFLLPGRPQAQFYRSFMDRCENVSILCSDIVSFTATSSTMSPQELVSMLNDVFARFDHIAQAEGCDRIKILGDGYVCVAGVPQECDDHADRCIKTGLRLAASVGAAGLAHGKQLQVRVGVHSGAVLCGVLGLRKWSFDVWGNDVLIATQLEASGRPGQVHISEDTREALQDVDRFVITEAPSLSFQKRQIETMFIKQVSGFRSVSLRGSRIGSLTSETLRSIQRPFANLPSLTSFDSDIVDQADLFDPDDIVSMDIVPVENATAATALSASGVATALDPVTMATQDSALPPSDTAQDVEEQQAATDTIGDGDDDDDDDDDMAAIWKCFSEKLEERSYLRTFFEHLNFRTLSFKKDFMTESYNKMPDDTFELNIIIYSLVILTSITVIRLGVVTSTLIRLVGWLALGPAVIVVAALVWSRFCECVKQRTQAIIKRIRAARTARTVITLLAYFVLHIIVNLGMVVCGELANQPHSIIMHNCTARTITADTTPSTTYIIQCVLVDKSVVILMDTTRCFTNESIPVISSAPISSAPATMSSDSSHNITTPPPNWTLSTNSSLLRNTTQPHGYAYTCNVSSEDAGGFLPIPTRPQENRCDFPHLVLQAEMFALVGMLMLFRTRFLYLIFVVIALAIVPVIFTWTLFKLPFTDTHFYWIGVSNGIDLPVYFGDFSIFLAVVAVLVVFTHARSMEIMLKINHIWNQEFSRSTRQNKQLRQANVYLLHNILPKHVAKHFLSQKTRSTQLYSCYHDNVAVMFCAIPKFSETFYQEVSSNRHGMECLRLLNEVFSDWDKLMSRSQYSTVEKIKTIGPTYMLVAGLHDPTGQHCAVSVLAMLAHDMNAAIDEINANAFNNFTLRIGLHTGSLVSGVIGARKPLFDIWGDTVNLASRMESTGINGKVQVTVQTGDVLRRRGFKLVDRGEIMVKGKGLMRTQFITEWPSARATRDAAVLMTQTSL